MTGAAKPRYCWTVWTSERATWYLPAVVSKLMATRWMVETESAAFGLKACASASFLEWQMGRSNKLRLRRLRDRDAFLDCDPDNDRVDYRGDEGCVQMDGAGYHRQQVEFERDYETENKNQRRFADLQFVRLLFGHTSQPLHPNLMPRRKPITATAAVISGPKNFA